MTASTRIVAPRLVIAGIVSYGLLAPRVVAGREPALRQSDARRLGPAGYS